MIPVGPIILLVRLLLRLGTGGRIGGSGRLHRFRFSGYLVAIGVAWGGWALFAIGGDVHVAGAVNWTLFVLFGFTWWLAGRTFVRLGMPRAAYWFGRATGVFGIVDEIKSGSCLLALRAYGYQRTMDVARLDWIEQRMPVSSGRGVWLASLALLAAHRGQLDRARALFLGVEMMPTECPVVVRNLAQRWLIADAAERGDLHAIVLIGRSPAFDRWVRSMRTLAGYACETRARTNFRWHLARVHIWMSWLMAPHRGATHRLQRRALANLTSRRSPPLTITREPSSSGDGHELLAEAVGALRELHRGGHSTASAIERVATAWDRVRESPRVQQMLEERGAALGVADVPSVDALVAEVEDELAHVLSRTSNGHSDFKRVGPTLGAAVSVIQDKLLVDLEAALAALFRRVRESRQLDLVEEYAAFGEIRALHMRAVVVGGDGLRRLVFSELHVRLCNYAVWLEQWVRPPLLQHVIFRYLLWEAWVAGDPEAMKLQSNNVRATS